MTDQHRADWLSCMGHPVVKTPHIDAIANSGTKFTDFHVASPVCMPNRSSLMTGRMPSVHRARYNGCPLPANENTFVDVLAKNGYNTASIGKSHLQPFTDTAPVHPNWIPGRSIEEAWQADTTDYFKEQPDRYTGQEYYDFPTPYYGFNHIDMIVGHGDQCGGHYQQWFRKNCPDWKALTDRSNELPHDYSCAQAYRTPIPEEYYSSAWIGDRAIDYLSQQEKEEDPFFAFVSFPDPHHPFNPPGRYWDMYSPDDFEIKLPYEAHANPTPAMEYLTNRFKDGLGSETPQSAFRNSPEHIRQSMALTAGMISMIDDQVGRVMQQLKDTNQYDNTVVIFTSDHGDFMGDFGLMLKGALQFRSITRVPMIWSDPDSRRTRTSNSLASTIDITSSILDRAGLLPYNGIQGQSFLPCVTSDSEHRDELFIEFNDALPRLGFTPAARVRTLLTRDYRLTCFKDQPWGELYDLNSDPDECINQWDNPAYGSIKAELAFRLINQLSGQMDDSPLTKRMA